MCLLCCLLCCYGCGRCRALDYVEIAAQSEPASVFNAFLRLKVYLLQRNSQAAADQIKIMLSCDDFSHEILRVSVSLIQGYFAQSARGHVAGCSCRPSASCSNPLKSTSRTSSSQKPSQSPHSSNPPPCQGPSPDQPCCSAEVHMILAREHAVMYQASRWTLHMKTCG